MSFRRTGYDGFEYISDTHDQPSTGPNYATVAYDTCQRCGRRYGVLNPRCPNALQHGPDLDDSCAPHNLRHCHLCLPSGLVIGGKYKLIEVIEASHGSGLYSSLTFADTDGEQVRVEGDVVPDTDGHSVAVVAVSIETAET